MNDLHKTAVDGIN